MATDAQLAMKGYRWIESAFKQRAGSPRDKEVFKKEIQTKDAFEIFQERFESEDELVMYFKEHPNVYAAINIFNAIMCVSYGVSVSQLRAVYKDIDLDYKKLNTKVFKATIKIAKNQSGTFKVDKESGKRQFNAF
jgi:hypothetical protein